MHYWISKQDVNVAYIGLMASNEGNSLHRTVTERMKGYGHKRRT